VKKIFQLGIFITVLALSTIPAQAYTIVTAFPDVTQVVQSVSEVATGPDMVGMSVTVTGFNEVGTAFSDTRTWINNLSVDLSPPIYGGVFPNGDRYAFYLFQAGDTYTSPWMLYSFFDVTISSITIDALPGNAVFDRTIDGMEKTPGSGQGKDFSTVISTIPAFPHLATYENQVAVGGQPPQGDLYRTLDIKLALNGILFFDSNYYELFTADTDRIVANVVPVPLGSSVTLLSTGLLGIIGLMRKYLS
jgi:hypothetical protein